MNANVTTQTIVNDLQTFIDEVKVDKKMDLEKKIKLVNSLTANQLRAGALSLGWARSVSRLPENAQTLAIQLNAVPEQTP